MANGFVISNPASADEFGGKLFHVPSYKGPISYANGVGDSLDPKSFGFPNNLIFVAASMAVSGTYYGVAQPRSGLITSWAIRWFIVGIGDEVSQGVDLSGETLQLMGIGI